MLYLQEPGRTAKVTASDIYKGQVGDCFLLSATGELAMDHPNGMIQRNANGAENVTLYTASCGGTLFGHGPSPLNPVSINVTNSFPSGSADRGAGQDVVGNQKEI